MISLHSAKGQRQRKAMQRPGLDDPLHARFAWDRYRKLMSWMVLASAVTVAAGLIYLKWSLGDVPLHMAIATILGLSVSVVLGGALMGLVFLSSGTGHDDHVINPLDEEIDD